MPIRYSLPPPVKAHLKEVQAAPKSGLSELLPLLINDDHAPRETGHESLRGARHDIRGPSDGPDPNEHRGPNEQEDPSDHESTPNGCRTIPNSHPPKRNPAPGKPARPLLWGPALAAARRLAPELR